MIPVARALHLSAATASADPPEGLQLVPSWVIPAAPEAGLPTLVGASVALFPGDTPDQINPPIYAASLDCPGLAAIDPDDFDRALQAPLPLKRLYSGLPTRV